jgi:hypothetical protein
MKLLNMHSSPSSYYFLCLSGLNVILSTNFVFNIQIKFGITFLSLNIKINLSIFLSRRIILVTSDFG